MAPKTAKLIHRRPLNADSWLLTFEVKEPLDFIGGQYVILNTGVKDAQGADVKRAYSLMSNDREQKRFELAVKALPAGPASTALSSLELGAELSFSGPWGKFIKNPLWPREGSTLLVVSDTAITLGLGLANSQKLKPLLSQLHMIWLVTDTQYFTSYETVNSRLPDELAHFQTVTVSPIGGPQRTAECAEILNRKLAEMIDAPANAFLAGDGNIIRSAQKILQDQGLAAEWIGCEPFFNKQQDNQTIPPGFVKSGTTGKLVATENLREGFTTGACSAAAAKAATRVLMTGRLLSEIETTLPNQRKVTFALKRCELGSGFAMCSVIKDAGDDPDVTHGAELTAHVQWIDEQVVVLKGGDGVATVTKAGLGLEIGGSAINSVPRKNICDMVNEELTASHFKGVEVTISVPGGLEMAKKTLNERLGLVGGISILGTSGIVKPYSTAAYRASVVQGIKVAKLQGASSVVLTTGGKSEAYAMKLFPALNAVSFIQVGDFIGTALKTAANAKMGEAIIVGMIGKLSKMADGRTMTHAAGSDVNIPMLAQIARDIGVPRAVCETIEKAVTARHVLELCQAAGFAQFPTVICERVARVMGAHAGPSLHVPVYLVDFDGQLLGSFTDGAARQGVTA